jgi:PAS domain S-box-containing protein
MTSAVIIPLTPRGSPASKPSRGANAARRKRNAQLAAIVESSLDAIVSVELESQRVLSWNGGAAQLFGYSEAEATGRSIDELIVPEERHDERVELYSAVSTGRNAVILETVRRHKEGRLIPVELRASPMIDRRDRVSTLSIVFRGMSGRRAEKRLRDSGHRLSQVFDAHPAYLGLLDREGRLIEVNKQALLATNAARDEVIGTAFAELPPWAYSAEAQREMSDIIAKCLSGETIRRDLPYAALGGEMRWVDFNATPLFAADGSVEGVIPFGMDITERKRAEAALATSEQRLRAVVSGRRLTAVLEALPIGVALVGCDGETLVSNEIYRRYVPEFVLSPDEARHVMWEGYLDDGRRIERKDFPVARALRGEQVWPGQEVLFHSADRQRPVWTRVAALPFCDERGEVVCITAVIDDIDAEKRAREALRRTERRLIAQKEALELAVSGATIDAVLKPVAEETQRQVSGNARVALYIVDPDGARLRFGATAGMSEGYTSAVDGFEIRPTNPSCGKVAFTGERIIVEDVMTDPLWEPYRALAQENDIRACWSFPIRSFLDRILGTIAIYYDSPRMPQPQDIEAVELLTQTAALVIERHKTAEERMAAHERLRRNELRLRIALAGARAGAWEWDSRTDGMVWSPEMFAITGLPPEAGAPSLDTYLRMVVEEDRGKAGAELKAALGKAGPFTAEFRIRRADGAVIWLSTAGIGEQVQTSKPLRAYGIQQDITERKQHEERLSLLSKEVNHRAKNMLMLVQAIARQTAASDPADFVERFQRRIQALAANQDLLVRSEWRGVGVDDLVRTQLAPFADLFDTRVKIDGTRFGLSATAAQALGMALHELATNAGKYGALSSTKGCVDIEWSVAASEKDGKDEFRISWRERGGPAVATPQRNGLGTAVISTMAKMSLRGNVDLDFRPDGVRWYLTCPAANVVDVGRA